MASNEQVLCPLSEPRDPSPMPALALVFASPCSASPFCLSACLLPPWRAPWRSSTQAAERALGVIQGWPICPAGDLPMTAAARQ